LIKQILICLCRGGIGRRLFLMESFTDTQNVELLQYRAINTTIELIVPKLKIRQSVALLVSK